LRTYFARSLFLAASSFKSSSAADSSSRRAARSGPLAGAFSASIACCSSARRAWILASRPARSSRSASSFCCSVTSPAPSPSRHGTWTCWAAAGVAATRATMRATLFIFFEISLEPAPRVRVSQEADVVVDALRDQAADRRAVLPEQARLVHAIAELRRARQL